MDARAPPSAPTTCRVSWSPKYTQGSGMYSLLGRHCAAEAGGPAGGPGRGAPEQAPRLRAWVERACLQHLHLHDPESSLSIRSLVVPACDVCLDVCISRINMNEREVVGRRFRSIRHVSAAGMPSLSCTGVGPTPPKMSVLPTRATKNAVHSFTPLFRAAGRPMAMG